jgi:hypothetical protein
MTNLFYFNTYFRIASVAYIAAFDLPSRAP